MMNKVSRDDIDSLNLPKVLESQLETYIIVIESPLRFKDIDDDTLESPGMTIELPSPASIDLSSPNDQKPESRRRNFRQMEWPEKDDRIFTIDSWVGRPLRIMHCDRARKDQLRSYRHSRLRQA